jgi:hypothetical protein
MSERTVIVHGPVTADLRVVLQGGGYVETARTEGCSIWVPCKPAPVLADKPLASEGGRARGGGTDEFDQR